MLVIDSKIQADIFEIVGTLYTTYCTPSNTQRHQTSSYCFYEHIILYTALNKWSLISFLFQCVHRWCSFAVHTRRPHENEFIMVQYNIWVVRSHNMAQRGVFFYQISYIPYYSVEIHYRFSMNPTVQKS